ncbi:hypothetical protein A0J61_10392 [Choanephora cucurbitarum]|uniref:Reverse transcriptase RNase H-like domain-containing protein n=1 Tax=Choanephora cucurbitarum TaxID=101091 RepID=A0A1C7MXR6_9FUNG|nr:hypothetical protein A0J61_10392 [Choanephora cucurbitarum]
MNGRSILPQTPKQTIYVDASDTGWGCFAPITDKAPLLAHSYWTHEKASMSINWRELKAAQLALHTFPGLMNMTVMIRTDNTTSLSYINKQGVTKSLPL